MSEKTLKSISYSDIVQLSQKYGLVTKEILEKEGFDVSKGMSNKEIQEFREQVKRTGNSQFNAINKSEAAIKNENNNLPKEPVNMTKTAELTSSKAELTTVINAALRGKEIPTQFQNALTRNGDGAVLIPESLVGDIEAAKKYNKPISRYVDVIPVKTPKGRYTTEDEGNHGELVNFDDDNQINEQDLKLKGVNWDLANYGSFTSLSEDLYGDSGFDLVKFFTNAHAEKATKTENKLVFGAIQAGLTPKVLADIQALKTSLNKDLDPALENEIMIITNQDGFELFNTLDAEGNLVKYLTVDGPKRFFDIYPFEVYSNDDLPSQEGKAPFIYGSLRRAVKLFTPKKVDILLAKNPFGIHKPIHVIRGVEAYDVKLIPETTQLIYGEIAIPE